MIGTRLAQFEITAKLGEGGMGTVYRGRDTRLGREVAIKVLPELFTADAERLARFEREAKLLASLNHPNIAGIYEVGEAAPEGGAGDHSVRESETTAGRPSEQGSKVHYLVMELAEGEDLAECLRRGPVPLEEGLEIAIQIAKALEAAHARGVIHRDLKPANVKLVPDGTVKVLDFGLAKAFDAGPGGAVQGDLTHSPTLTAQMTSAGMILGTAAYMSPEQAKGEEADKRSDIWSFGVVLWEMLTGRKTFDEKTVSETLAAVLKSDPDHSALPPNLPLAVRRLIERCLQKDPDQRLHDIADARLELEAVLRGEDGAVLVVEADEPTKATARRWKIVALVATLVAPASLTLHYLADDTAVVEARQPVRFAIDRPPGYLSGSGPGLAISRDGTQVAYWAKNAAGNDQIFLRRLDSVEAQPVAGTEGGVAPFFSPDGSRLGFWKDFGLFVVSIHGGAPTLVADTQNFRGATWARDGTIWFSPDTESGLWRLDPDSSAATQITSPDAERGERSHRWPTLLPDDDTVLFTVGTADITRFDEARIDAFRLSTGERKTVFKGGMYPLFLPPDILLFTVSGTLVGVPFDTEDLEVFGAPTPLLEGVKTLPLSGVAATAISSAGSLVTGLGEPFFGARKLVEYDRNGDSRRLTEEIRPYQALALSPDETILALDVDAANATIWLLDLERDIQTRLTTRWSHNIPVWSPDGSSLVSSSSSGGTYQIHRHRLTTGESEVLHQSREAQFFATSWSNDDRLAVTVIPTGQSNDIWLLPVDDPAAGKPLVATPFYEWAATFSPDGRWVAFNSNESGRDEIYVVPADGSGAKVRVSSEGGYFPTWGPEGDFLYFHDGGRILEAAVVPSERLRIGAPQPLFPTGSLFQGALGTMAVTADGRFVTIEYLELERETAMDVVMTRHWLHEIQQKLR